MTAENYALTHQSLTDPMRIFSIKLLSLTIFVLQLMSYMFAVFYIYRFV